MAENKQIFPILLYAYEIYNRVTIYGGSYSMRCDWIIFARSRVIYMIYRSLTQAIIIHTCVCSIGWRRSRNLHKREYFGKGSLEQWTWNGIIRQLIIKTPQYNINSAKNIFKFEVPHQGFYEMLMIAAFSYSPRLNRFIFNENRRENYDMINNFQQSRRQFIQQSQIKSGRGGGGGLQHELE